MRKYFNFQFRKSLWLAFILSCLPLSLSLAEIRKPKINGFFDSTYNYDFNRPLSGRSNYRLFDSRTNNFLLNVIQVNIDGSAQEGLGYRGELGFGADPSAYKAAGTNNIGETPITAAGPSNTAYNFEIQEMYVTYNWTVYPIMVKAGKFESLGGLETIESMNNFNVTRGFIFTMARPLTYVGAIIGYRTPYLTDFWIGMVNGWDLHVDNNTDKTLLINADINLNENLYGSLSFSRGAEQNANNDNKRTTIDTTWYFKPLLNALLGAQILYAQENGVSRIDENSNGVVDTPFGTAKWYGFNLQGKYDYSKFFSLGARFEILNDVGGARTLVPYINAGIIPAGVFRGEVLKNFTITPAFKISNALLVRTEYRYDWAIEQVFEDSRGNTRAGALPTERSLSSLSLEVVYKF